MFSRLELVLGKRLKIVNRTGERTVVELCRAPVAFANERLWPLMLGSPIAERPVSINQVRKQHGLVDVLGHPCKRNKPRWLAFGTWAASNH